MRAWATATLLAGTVLAAAGSAGAQSLYGPGGLFLNPTAAVPRKGEVTPAILVLPQYNPVAKATRTWLSSTLDYGATEDLEVGATLLKVTNWNRSASAGGYAKYRFARESKGYPSAAAGFTWLGFGDVDSRIAFLALRKQLAGNDPRAAHPIVLHVGAQYFNVLDGIPRDEVMPFAGMEIGLMRRLTLIAEGRPQGKADFSPPVAVTLAYRYTSTGRLALTWANNGLSNSPRFGFGAGITIGSR